MGSNFNDVPGYFLRSWPSVVARRWYKRDDEDELTDQIDPSSIGRLEKKLEFRGPGRAGGVRVRAIEGTERQVYFRSDGVPKFDRIPRSRIFIPEFARSGDPLHALEHLMKGRRQQTVRASGVLLGQVLTVEEDNYYATYMDVDHPKYSYVYFVLTGRDGNWKSTVFYPYIRPSDHNCENMRYRVQTREGSRLSDLLKSADFEKDDYSGGWYMNAMQDEFLRLIL